MLTQEQLAQYLQAGEMKRIVGDMHADMKAEVDSEFAARYAETRDKSRDVTVDGEVVGTLTWVPGAEAKQVPVLVVDDPGAFTAWAEANGYMAVDTARVESDFAETGEVPDGCSVEMRSVGGKRGYTRATPKKAYRASIEARFRKALGDGDE